MVRVVRLERTVSWSQTRRDTNFAIPGYSLFCHDTPANGKNKVFSVCGHSCGQSHFCAVFGNRGKSSKRRCCKALRRFALLRLGYRHGTPKASALPTALIPDIQFPPLYHGVGENQRFFCLWSKPLLCRFRQSEQIPQTQASQGFAAFHIARPGYRRSASENHKRRRPRRSEIPDHSAFTGHPRISPNRAPCSWSCARRRRTALQTAL